MVEYKDYYKILGVNKSASQDEIKRAFRKLARQYHPDANPNDPKTEEKFKEIGEAYEVLKDSQKRSRYDQLGANWKQYAHAGTGWPGGGRKTYTHDFGGRGFNFEDLGSDFSDFFEAFFGRGSDDRFSGFDPGFSTQFDRGTRTNMQKGQDMQSELSITLREACSGTQRSLKLQTGGRTRTVNVKIPKGIKNGGKIRVAGEGAKSPAGGPAGDLYLVINIAPHNFFTRKGDDLYCEVPVTIKEAFYGAKIDIPTFSGKIMVKVPPKTQGGKTLRLKGKGIPKLRSSEFGDLYAKIKLILPEKLNSEQKRHFEEFARSYDENPRENIII
ncbi:MAG: DnaJ domain-containing protein [Actinobacteria bacterium]|nr:DnaJ domain-containing protein [Actinomycetota bacterium]